VRHPILCAVLLSPFLAIASAHAAVSVTYGDPDRFTDAGDRSNDPVKIAKSLEQHLKDLGEHYLPANANLKIEILDVDRAGRPHMNLPTEIRVVTGKADPPCIDLRYTLEIDGQVRGPTRERVCDLDYLRPLPVRASEHDPLVYEKRMLHEWFRERFASPASSSPRGSPPR
jgi:hypothetical protein